MAEKSAAKTIPAKRAIDHWPPILAVLVILDLVLCAKLNPAAIINSPYSPGPTLYALVSSLLPWLFVGTFLTALISVAMAANHHTFNKLQQLNVALAVSIVGLVAFSVIGLYHAYG